MPITYPNQRSIVISSVQQRNIVSLLVHRNASGEYRVQYEQAFTGAVMDFVNFGGPSSNVSCTGTVNGTSDSAAAPCFSLLYCSNTPLAGLIPSTQPDEFPSAYFTLKITLGPQVLSNPVCTTAASVTAGIVMVDDIVVTAPIYRFAVIATGPPPSRNRTAAAAWLTATGLWNGSAGSPLITTVATVTSARITDGSAVALGLVAFAHAGFAELSAVTLSSSTATAALCTITDVQSFSRTFFPALLDIGANFSLDCSIGAGSVAADSQTTCLGDATCLGLLTAAEDNSPLCYLRSGRGVDTQIGSNRWLLLKTAQEQRTCTVLLDWSGKVEVYVRQTSFATGSVSVYVGLFLVATCGGTRPFAGGQFGRSAQCDLLYLCYSGHVAASQSVRVVADTAVGPYGCDSALSVVFNATLDAVDVTLAPLPRLPSSLTVSKLQQNFPVRLFLQSTSLAATTSMRVLAVNVGRVVLNVLQSGFDCSRWLGGSCAGGQPAITLYSSNSLSGPWTMLQSCGGSAPFLKNVSGFSDQCSRALFCGPPVFIANGTVESLAAQSDATSTSGSGAFAADSSTWAGVVDVSKTATLNSPFALWLRLDVATSSIRYASTLCKQFAAELYASAALADGLAAAATDRNVSGFVLHDGPGRFKTLLAPRVGFVPDVTMPSSRSLVPLNTVNAILGKSDPREVYLANLSGAVLGPNASLACIMDWLSGGSGVCSFAVPAAANYVAVQVAQNNFLAASMAVETLNSAGAVVSSVSCGGSFGFSGFASRSDRCDVFLPCGSGFLATGAALIRITVPAAATTSVLCTIASAVVVDYSLIKRAVPLSCPYQCKADRTCFPLTAICDGVVDCSDGADETQCSDWFKIEADSLSSLVVNSTIRSVTSYINCRNWAVFNETTLFGLAANRSVCVVYSKAPAVAYLDDPATFIVAAPGFQLFARLPFGVSSYSRCSSQLTCSDHGTVIVTRVRGTVVCTCTCAAGFSGSDCSTKLDLSATGALNVFFNDSTPLLPYRVEAALLSAFSNSTDLTVSCEAFVQFQGLLTTSCHFSGPPDAVASIEAATATRSAVGHMTAQLDADAGFISFGLTTQPLPQRATCTGSIASFASTCSIGQPIKLLKLAAKSASGIPRIDVQLSSGAGGARRSQGALACFAENKNMFQTPTRDGCVETVCLMTADGSPVSTIDISTPNFTASPSDRCFTAVVATFTVPLSLPSVIRTHPANSVGDYSPFLIGGIIVIVVATVMMAVAAVALRVRVVAIRQAVGDVDELSGQGELKALLLSAFRRMKCFGEARIVRAQKWSNALAVGSFDLAVLGIFLALYFSTSSSYGSNVQVMIEAYRTSDCGLSQTSPLATRASLVAAATARSCMQREVTGIEAGAIFAAAYCDNTTGTPMAYVKIGSSLGDCAGMPFREFPLGACIPSFELLPLINDSSYISIDCGALESTQSRMNTFLALNAPVAENDAVPVTPLAPQFQQHWSQPSLQRLGDGVFLFPRVASASVMNASSHSACRFESVATPQDLVDQVSALRVVQMQPSETYLALGAAHPLSDSAEAKTNVRSLESNITQLGPGDGDYALGFVYNSFGVGAEMAREAAGPGAAKYYDVAGSAADIGRYFSARGPDSSGLTITLYLRATRLSQGFVFAITDAREDTVLQVSPLLNRLETMIGNDSPDSAWYSAHYNVYSALYVDGPGSMLRFLFANADSDSAVVRLVWDLSALDLMHVFNGLWHHVAVIMRVENGRPKAQLVVDGVTSETRIGWNQCMPRGPAAIAALDPAAVFPVINMQNEILQQGGLLYTGYFNGAVAHLEFTPTKVDVFDLWRGSTLSIQQHNAINMDQYVGLGAALIAVGVVMLVGIGFTSAAEMHDDAMQQSEVEKLHSFEAYAALWKLAPKDSAGRLYAPVRWTVAKRWLDLDAKLLGVFVEQLRYNFKKPAEEFVRLMHAFALSGGATVDLTLPAPTSWEWQLLIEGEHEQAMSILTEHFRRGSSHEEDPADLYAIVGVTTLGTGPNPVESPLSSNVLARTASTVAEIDYGTDTDVSVQLSSIALDVSSQNALEASEPGDAQPSSEPAQMPQPRTTSFHRFNVVAHLVAKFGTSSRQPGPPVGTQLLTQNPEQSARNSSNNDSSSRQDNRHQAVGIKVPTTINGKIPRTHGNAPTSGKNDSSSHERNSAGKGNSEQQGLSSGSIAGELIATVLMTVQSTSVWMSAMPVPAGYLANFQSPFAVFSIDITNIVHTNPVATPLAQLFAGFVVFGVLFYFIESDEQAFLANMARYVVRRDSLDTGDAQLDRSVHTTATFDAVADALAEDGFGEMPHNGKVFTVPLLPLAQAQKIDVFLGRTNETAASGSIAQLKIHDLHNVEYVLHKPAWVKKTSRLDCGELEVHSEETETSALRVVGHECPLHHGRALGKQLQSDVWPFRFRPSCCVEVGGRRCDASVGNMFVCGHIDTSSGDQSQCLYALCDRHFRAPLKHELIAPLIAIYRAIVRRGTVWAIVGLFLLLANAAYTPLMKTALMILACDPSYQCEFQSCWSNPDRQFTLAAYLCVVIATVYGLGFPFGLVALLHRRSMMLRCIFFAPEYEGRYLSDDKTTVEMSEWRRFVYTDPTALGKLYATFELEWIYVPPIMLFWKAALLLPAIFIERGTFGQMVGVAAVQFLVGLFLFLTEPSISPLVDMLYKLGGAHQMLLLGLLALNRRQQYVDGTRLDKGCIALTATYLVICLLATAISTALPIVRRHLERRRVSKVLVKLGMQYTGTTGLYVVPNRKILWADVSDSPDGDATRKATPPLIQGKPPSMAPAGMTKIVVASDRGGPDLAGEPPANGSTETSCRQVKGGTTSPLEIRPGFTKVATASDSQEKKREGQGNDLWEGRSRHHSNGPNPLFSPRVTPLEESHPRPSVLVTGRSRGLNPAIDEMLSASRLASDPLMAQWRRAAEAVDAARGRSVVLVHPELEFWTPALAIAALQTAAEEQRPAAVFNDADSVVLLDAPSATRVLVVASTASAAQEAFESVVSITSSSFGFSVAFFTDASKFADDVERLNRGCSSPPAIVVGSLRRITDLVKRGVLQTSSLHRLVIPSCEDIASIPADLERLRTLLQFVDVSTTPILATCGEDSEQAIQSAITALAPDSWIWMKNI